MQLTWSCFRCIICLRNENSEGNGKASFLSLYIRSSTIINKTTTKNGRSVTMTKLSTVCLLLALVVTGHLMSGSLAKPKDHKGPKCKGWHDLVSQCSRYVAVGKPVDIPTKRCCKVVKKADLSCACKKITASRHKRINVKKLVLVASYCGKRLRHGTHCGRKSIILY